MDENLEKFFLNNEAQLKKIYKEGLENYEEGLLYIKYDIKDDKIDVIFLNIDNINKVLTEEGWKEMKEKGKDKIICMVHNGEKMCIVHLN